MISTSIGNKNFIEVKKISPFVSKVIIKVLYIGMSSNRSLITREFADKLAESLPGSAIVGKYDYFDQDFLEHEERISIKEGKAQIDSTLCVGCKVCTQMCKFGALEQ